MKNPVYAKGALNDLLNYLQENPAYAIRLIELLHQFTLADQYAGSPAEAYAQVLHDLLTQARSVLDVPQVTEYLC